MEIDFDGTLAGLKPGDEATVCNVCVGLSLKRRLLDLGLVPNTKVRCVGVSPAGDPVAYLIRGAVIALRRCDGDKIYVTRGEGIWG